jgi:Ala-tRNA(Pro) deacylase
MTVARTVKMYLESQEVEYQLVAHPRSFSSKETAAAAHIPEDHIAKAVILKDELGFLMAVIPASNWIKLHALQEELDRTLELATESEVDGLLKDCQPGAVPPLGPAYELETILDEALTTLAQVCFEAGDHEHLVRVSGEDFRRLLGGARHAYISHNN